MSHEVLQLCSECGASLRNDERQCAHCGTPSASLATDRPTAQGPEVDRAWARVLRMTWVFLLVNLTIRAAQAFGSRRALGFHAGSALVGAAIVGAVLHALTHRRTGVLAAWSWFMTIGALVALVGLTAFRIFNDVPLWRMGLASASIVTTMVYAMMLWRARRVIEH